MSLESVLFYFFAAISIVTSILVISSKNPVLSALSLILNFAGLAGVYLTLYAQFIAVVQVIVYAGAIMVLFLFVIMLIRPEAERNYFQERKSFKMLTIGIGVIVLGQLMFLIISGTSMFTSGGHSEQSLEVGTVERIGWELMTSYLLPFEAIGFLLLAASIGAMVLAKKKFE
ncbi:MAG: NADH-quinone oxidoreductase subunit J [Ignavibacteriaceae bacterium]|nr:NADH-quinone oxidoreductase subunit J [Ignavibacteriaceae bacterium]